MSFLQTVGASVRLLLSRIIQRFLRRYWLLLARAVWMVLVVAAIGLFVISLPAAFIQLHHICTIGTCSIPWELSSHDLQALKRLRISLNFYVAYTLALAVALVFSYLVIGIIIFWQKCRDGLALFFSLALITWGAVGLFADQLVMLQPTWKATITLVSFTSTIAALVFVYVFPDGRCVPRFLRWLVVVWIALEVIYSFFPNSPLSQRVWPDWLSTVTWVGSWGIGLLSQIYRYARVSTHLQRQQTRWVVFGLAVSISLFLIGGGLEVLLRPSDQLGEAHLLSLLISQFLGVLALMFPPICIGIAILHARLWDIDLIINRTLIYGILTASVIGLYTLVVGFLGTFLQAQGNIVIELVATGMVAVLFQPLRNALQRGINRLMFGERDDPYRVISRLGQRLEATLAPGEVLPAIVETVARSLKLPSVAIHLKQDEVFTMVACYGLLKEPLLHLPLIYQAEMLGELVVAPRTAHESFTRSERHLLDELARQAGIAVHTVLLTTDLERSRQHIVAAREEGRRRLGSDLHDGLGHTLASLLRTTDTASQLLEHDPTSAQRLLSEMKQRTKSAIDDTRRLAHSLHPPELELLGLLPALRERVQQYQQPDGDVIHLHLESPSLLPPLPIAVEAATYYITLEALNNVQHHAQAQHCQLRLELVASDDTLKLLPGVWNASVLELEICDDGCGLPEEAQDQGPGLGFASMHERATELGGTCLIERVATGGTRVFARLPCLHVTDKRR